MNVAAGSYRFIFGSILRDESEQSDKAVDDILVEPGVCSDLPGMSRISTSLLVCMSHWWSKTRNISSMSQGCMISSTPTIRVTAELSEVLSTAFTLWYSKQARSYITVLSVLSPSMPPCYTNSVIIRYLLIFHIQIAANLSSVR